ncbi:MAG: hypothetical protein DWI57_00425 [Chloroflexi bacterium]|nr:MAG: hypothetical protein DWI57_00425 [Chloroflexota bacterium]
MYSNLPQPNQPPDPTGLPSVDEINRELFAPRPSFGKRLRRIFGLLLPLLVLLLILLIVIPPWRARFLAPVVDRLLNRLPSGEGITANPGGALLVGDTSAQTVAITPATPVATFTPTPTPHPAAALDFAIDSGAGRVYWQIAYPDERRGPGLGCAYVGFWLTGGDAEKFDLLSALEAELLISDGDAIIERHGPTPLNDLRSLGEPRYYELPAGEPDCAEHRFAEASDYAGLEFRLRLLVDQTEIRQYRAILGGADAQMATPTPTATPAPPTPTPFPQVRIGQAVNVRAGPDVAYGLLGAANAGAVYPVTGANPQFTWWQIDYLGQRGWVYGELVEALAVADVQIVTDIPPAPTPAPTATPLPPTPTLTAVPTPYFPFLLKNNGVCEPNAAMTYFKGKVQYASGDPFTGACVHISYEGPRNTKCTGCGGEPAGEWGFAPFGNLPGKQGVTVRIYVVPCPEEPLTGAGQNPETGFGPLYPVSQVWTYTIGESVQCTGIVFQDNRYYDAEGNVTGPP